MTTLAATSLTCSWRWGTSVASPAGQQFDPNFWAFWRRQPFFRCGKGTYLMSTAEGLVEPWKIRESHVFSFWPVMVCRTYDWTCPCVLSWLLLQSTCVLLHPSFMRSRFFLGFCPADRVRHGFPNHLSNFDWGRWFVSMGRLINALVLHPDVYTIKVSQSPSVQWFCIWLASQPSSDVRMRYGDTFPLL